MRTKAERYWKNAVRPDRSRNAIPGVPFRHMPPDRGIEFKDECELILSAIDPEGRAMVAARFGVGTPEVTTTEIAERRGVTPSAVNKQIRRAFEPIRRRLNPAA